MLTDVLSISCVFFVDVSRASLCNAHDLLNNLRGKMQTEENFWTSAVGVCHHVDLDVKGFSQTDTMSDAMDDSGIIRRRRMQVRYFVIQKLDHIKAVAFMFYIPYTISLLPVMTEKSQLFDWNQSETPSVCQLFSALGFADIGLAGVSSFA